MKPTQVAVMNICYQFYPLKYFLESVKKMGVANVDIWAGYPHFVIEDGCEAEAKQMRSMCDDLGLRIICFTPKQIGLPMNIADERLVYRKKALDYLKKAVDLSDILGTNMLQIVPGSGMYNEKPEKAWEYSRESLKEISQYALSAGKVLILEPLQRIESNLINDVYALKAMLDQVGSPALQAVVDTCHMEKGHETLTKYFEVLGDHIRHIHLNESNQLPWGEGNSDINTYLSQIKEYDYKGYVTLEVCSRPHYIHADWAMSKNVGYVFEALKRQ